MNVKLQENAVENTEFLFIVKLDLDLHDSNEELICFYPTITYMHAILDGCSA